MYSVLLYSIYIHIHLYTVDLETQNHPELDRTEMS